MNFLRRLMYGRYGTYGVDPLNYALLLLYLVLQVLHFFTRWSLLLPLSTLLAVFALFRLLSRNLPARRRENERFLSLSAPLRSWLHAGHLARSDKDHLYFKCPNCGQQLRVPRGQGKIKVTCRTCGSSFEKKS